MTTMKATLSGTAAAALLALPFVTGGAFAQQAQSTDQAQQSATSSESATGQQSAQSGTSGQTGNQEQADTLVATVGDAEIRGSDVMTVIGMLPPQLQAQPAQMLVPIALDQLILRELILEQARAENLAQDPDVVALVNGAAEGAEEDAMVQVWIDRETANAVTDEAVQEVYGTLQPQGDQPVPALEALRPQIEQHLRRQAMEEVRNRLQQGADIVLYDPSGQPLPQDQQIRNMQNTSGASNEGAQSDQSSGGSTGGSSGEQSGSD